MTSYIAYLTSCLEVYFESLIIRKVTINIG